MDKFNVSILYKNLKNSDRKNNEDKNQEFIECFNYLKDKFNEATLNGSTSIIIEDYIKAKIST